MIAKAGEVVELDAEKGRFDSEYKRKWYQGMIALLRSRGKNENRAYHLYREKFGVDPRWKKEPGEILPECVGYLQRANIAYRKASRKTA